VTAPGWYPDPSDPAKQIYWDGTAWSGLPSPIESGKPTAGSAPALLMADPAKKLNAFFVMLAVIAAMPTLFFGVGTFASEGNPIMVFAFLWSAAWTYVWYSLRHR
jgi:hypothetical protein